MAWITVLVGLMGDLFKASYNVDADQRAKLVKIASAVAVVIVLAVVAVGLHTASGPADPNHPSWEVVILARLVLARSFFAVGLLAAAILSAVLAFNALEHSSLGKRLMVWKTDGQVPESISVQAQKTANGGRMFAVLVVAAALVFAAALK